MEEERIEMRMEGEGEENGGEPVVHEGQEGGYVMNVELASSSPLALSQTFVTDDASDGAPSLSSEEAKQ
jgi:hypothetical protein